MKKMLSLLLASVLCFTLCVPAFATEQVADEVGANVTVVNRSATISDQAVNEIAKDVAVTLVHDDGTITPVDTVVTIENIASSSTRSAIGVADTYQVRVDSKIETDTDVKNDEGVSAAISLTMRWTDVPGTSNTIDSLEGSLTIDKGTLKNAYYTYGDGTVHFNEKVDIGTRTSFYQTIGRVAWNPHSWFVAHFDNASWQLNVYISPSVFD